MQLVVGESILIDESLSPYESLRIFFEVAEERGHSAPSVVVDERGTPLTHPDYIDRMGAAHVKAGAWAFCRRPAAEAFGLLSGTDRVREHSLHLMFEGGSPYLTRPHLHDQIYVQRFDDPWPLPLSPVSSAQPVAWNNEGSRLCLLEERLGHVADGTDMAGFVLWEYEILSGRRRRVADFPARAKLGFNQVSYSPDDRWIHLCEWAWGRNFLVRLADGLVVTLPVESPAMDWNPRRGPSAMVAMIPDQVSGRLVIYDYDLTANVLERRSDLESPTGLPLAVREMSMSADGYLALVTAPVGVAGLDQGIRGGVQVAAVIDIDEGSIEPVLPVGFRTRSAQRRHTSPRWCDQPARNADGGVVVAEALLHNASAATCDPDSPAISQDVLSRWIEVLEGITAAWTSGRMPPARFADEYVQYALSCYELDEQATEVAVSDMRHQARTDPFARTVIRALDANRERNWGSPGALPRPEPATATGQEAATIPGIPTEGNLSERQDALAGCLDRLIAAESLADARIAARELRVAAEGGSAGDGAWPALTKASATGLAGRNYIFTAKLGLGTVFWKAFFHPDLAASGLPQVPESDLLPIVLNGFEACTHLPERTVIGADNQSIFDAEDTRNRCQQLLNGLPLADFLTATPRARVAAGPGESRVPSPTDDRLPRGDAPVAVRKRVFISYVREDSGPVDRIVAALLAKGFDVWLDRTHIVAGMRWKSVIRKAIRGGDYFVACFSPHYASKDETYMNEELILAIERLRLMHQSRQWFIPIKLEECEIPDREIGAGETLTNIHYIDFSRDWDEALAQLIAALSPPED